MFLGVVFLWSSLTPCAREAQAHSLPDGLVAQLGGRSQAWQPLVGIQVKLLFPELSLARSMASSFKYVLPDRPQLLASRALGSPREFGINWVQPMWIMLLIKRKFSCSLAGKGWELGEGKPLPQRGWILEWPSDLTQVSRLLWVSVHFKTEETASRILMVCSRLWSYPVVCECLGHHQGQVTILCDVIV